MRPTSRILLSVLLASAIAACATRPQSASAPQSASKQRAAVTGSRIPVPVDARTGQAPAGQPTQSVNQQDIQSTGQDEPGAALRMLVPEVH